MTRTIGAIMDRVLGLGTDELAPGQMALRALIVYVAALAMVRAGEKRFLGKSTAFDVVLAIVFGSVVSRAITGSSAFFPTLGAGAVIVALHWAFAALAFRSDRFGTLIKGAPRVLVADGAIRWDAMRRSNISRDDLLGALRSEGRVAEVGDVREARLERSGDISVLRAAAEPKVLEVRVEDGVQTVRLRLE